MYIPIFYSKIEISIIEVKLLQCIPFIIEFLYFKEKYRGKLLFFYIFKITYLFIFLYKQKNSIIEIYIRAISPL